MLDKAFGLPSKRFFSQRDVPGVPRSVIPIMKRNGIGLITCVGRALSLATQPLACSAWISHLVPTATTPTAQSPQAEKR